MAPLLLICGEMVERSLLDSVLVLRLSWGYPVVSAYFFRGNWSSMCLTPLETVNIKYCRKILAGKSKGATNGLVMQAYKWLTGKGEHEISTLVGAFILSSSPIEL
jgi:hypothetical protein